MSTPQDTSTGDTAVFASGLSIFASGMPMFTLAHDAPLSLDDATRCWIVRSGSLDLFLVPEGGGRQHPVLRINAGDAVLGTGSPHGWRMIALGSQGARVTELAAAMLYDTDVGRDAIARWLQAWNVKLKDKPFPKKVERVVPGQPLVLAAGESAVPMADSTCVELETGEASFMGAVVLAPPTALFVTASGWIEAKGDCRLGARSAADLAAEGRLAAVLEATHAAYIACLRDNFAQAAVRERARLGVRARKDQARMQAATATLRSVVLGDAVRGLDTPDMLLAACRVVGVAAGIDFVEHAASKRGWPQADPLGNIASASRVRKRTVALKGEWWKTDSGPLLAFYGEIRSPVALIPVRGRGYNLHDPVSGKVIPVDAALAQTLQPFAYTFYRSFAAPALDLLALMRFASFGITREIILVLALGLVAGILGLSTPYLTGQLFDDIIPSADKSRLWQIVFALAAAGIAGSMFDITRSFTVLRMEGRVDSNVQAAVWDRLLRLPVPFFRKYTAGDLAMRAGAINAIRSALSGSVMSVIFSSLFSTLNLVLLFYYSSRLAWIAVILVAVLFMFTITGSMFRLYFERRLAEGAGKQAGMVLQFLLGIAKLRAAGAEGRAFGLWAANYAKQQRYVYNAQTIGTVLGSISAMYPLLASLVIFIAVTMFMTDLKAPLTTGEFLAFNAAFGAFLGAALGLGSTLLGLLSVVPMYERPGAAHRRHRVESCNLQLRQGLVTGIGRRLVPDTRRRIRRLRRSVGLGQIHATAPSAGFRDAERGHRVLRRTGFIEPRCRCGETPDRRGIAERPAVGRRHLLQYRRFGAPLARRSGGRGQGLRARRRYQQYADGHAYPDPGRRRQPLGRAAPAHADRARDRHQAAHFVPG
jgi:hypothetical protein